VCESLNILQEWLYIEELNEHYKRQAEAYGEDAEDYQPADFYDPEFSTSPVSEFGEGVAVRNFQGKRSDGSWKPYYPSAEKGDRMATGEELQALFGVTYVDERNEQN
jgi:hypothetical protein